MKYVKIEYGALSVYYKIIGKTKCPYGQKKGGCEYKNLGRCIGKGLRFIVLPIVPVQGNAYYAPICWVKGDIHVKGVTETEVAVSLL